MKRIASETKSRPKSPRLAVIAATNAAKKRALKIVNVEDVEPPTPTLAVVKKNDNKEEEEEEEEEEEDVSYLHKSVPMAMLAFVLVVICCLFAANWYKIPIMIDNFVTSTPYLGFPWKDEVDKIAFKTSPGGLLIHTINAFALAIVAGLLLCRMPPRVRRVLLFFRAALYAPFAIVVVKNLNHLGPMTPEMAVANNLLLLLLLHSSISWSYDDRCKARPIGAHRAWHARHADLIFFVTLMIAPAAEVANRIVYEMSR